MKVIFYWIIALILVILTSYVGRDVDYSVQADDNYPPMRVVNAPDYCKEHDRNHQHRE